MPALVVGEDRVTGPEGADLMEPHASPAREAVDEDHDRSLALDRVMYVDAVDGSGRTALR
jgi:hypothetical protein